MKSRWFEYFISILALLFITFVLTYSAKAHDIYKDLREGYSNTGPLCCGGDPVTGDCEGVSHGDYQITKEGDLILKSKRYGGTVFVPAYRVVWLQINEEYPVHWCGRPLGDPLDHNTEYKTYCAFVAAGGF